MFPHNKRHDIRWLSKALPPPTFRAHNISIVAFIFNVLSWKHRVFGFFYSTSSMSVCLFFLNLRIYCGTEKKWGKHAMDVLRVWKHGHQPESKTMSMGMGMGLGGIMANGEQTKWMPLWFICVYHGCHCHIVTVTVLTDYAQLRKKEE